MSRDLRFATINTWLWPSFAEFRKQVRPISKIPKDHVEGAVYATALTNLEFAFSDRDSLKSHAFYVKQLTRPDNWTRDTTLTDLSKQQVEGLEKSIRAVVWFGE
jgi:hypothetical protein